MYGKILRMRNIFDAQKRRALIVAMDHGLSDGPLPGIEDPLETLNAIIKAGATGVILNPGMFSRLSKVTAGRIGSIMRADFIFTSLSENKQQPNLPTSTVYRALRLGADALIANGFIGSEEESHNIQFLAEIAEEAEGFNVPLGIEIKPRGPLVDSKKAYDVEYVKPAVRVAAELGADFVKTFYTGSKATFKQVVDSATVPVVVLGGPRVDNIVDLLQSVSDAVDAGGAGIAYGRNIWYKRDPYPITTAFSRIIYQNDDPKTVAKELNLV